MKVEAKTGGQIGEELFLLGAAEADGKGSLFHVLDEKKLKVRQPGRLAG